MILNNFTFFSAEFRSYRAKASKRAESNHGAVPRVIRKAAPESGKHLGTGDGFKRTINGDDCRDHCKTCCDPRKTDPRTTAGTCEAKTSRTAKTSRSDAVKTLRLEKRRPLRVKVHRGTWAVFDGEFVNKIRLKNIK